MEMRACVRECVYIYIYIYGCVCVCVCVHIYIYIYMDESLCCSLETITTVNWLDRRRVWGRMETCVCVYTYIYVYVCVCIYIYVYIWMSPFAVHLKLSQL